MSAPSVDVRTRTLGPVAILDPHEFFASTWRAAASHHGARAAADARHLGLDAVTLVVDGTPWTLRPTADAIVVEPARASDLVIAMDGAAFAELVSERRSALGLAVGGRLDADPDAAWALCGWDPVLRSLLDGRPVYRPGDIALDAPDGSPLDLHDCSFRLGDDDPRAGQFLAQAGFVLLRDVVDAATLDALDHDLDRAVHDATPDDGKSWWAGTADGARYPCRILDFAAQSETLRRVVGTDRYRAIGALLGDGHLPGDPFGEHFADVTAEGLLKRVESVEGLACLPWHKDCDRGGHSQFCSGLTIGICLTAVDEAHGGLDVLAGSHRANIARSQVDSIDLPAVTLRAERGDLTVHLSCALHRSTHPTTDERRVVYTGFTLPLRGTDHHDPNAQSSLRRDRAALGDPSSAARIAGTP